MKAELCRYTVIEEVKQARMVVINNENKDIKVKVLRPAENKRIKEKGQLLGPIASGWADAVNNSGNRNLFPIKKRLVR